MKKISLEAIAFITAFTIGLVSISASGQDDGTVTYGKGFRKEEGGWIYLHIEGSAKKRGEQMGYLMAKNIEGYITVFKVKLANETTQTWDDYRKAAEDYIVAKVDKEYLDEMKGIVKGMEKAGTSGYDLTDIITLNAGLDLGTYFSQASSGQANNRLLRSIPKGERMRCSAFIATGSATKTGGVVIAHNTWDYYLMCQYDNIILDIKPTKGARMLMQGGSPGLIQSGTDFAITSYGLMITETCISEAKGYDVNGIPEFVRVRKATQYAKTIDDFYRILRTGNNGGYPCTWLVGDNNTNEIAKIELACKNVAFYRSMDGYYDGQNFVDDSKMIREECSKSLWDVSNGGLWPFNFNCTNNSSFRRMRWFALLDGNKGLVDVDKAKEFLADQTDPLTGVSTPGPNNIMARYEVCQPKAVPLGADDGIVTTSELAKNMFLWARFNHPDGSIFTWDDAFFNANPEYKWQQPYLRNLENNPWTLFFIAPKK